MDVAKMLVGGQEMEFKVGQRFAIKLAGSGESDVVTITSHDANTDYFFIDLDSGAGGFGIHSSQMEQIIMLDNKGVLLPRFLRGNDAIDIVQMPRIIYGTSSSKSFGSGTWAGTFALEDGRIYELFEQENTGWLDRVVVYFSQEHYDSYYPDLPFNAYYEF